MRFVDRHDAGTRLAKALKSYKGKDVIVYALPRGGVVLGVEIAKLLQAPLELIMPRKITHPYSPEYAIAAVTEDGNIVAKEEELSHIDPKWFKKTVAKELAEAKRRRELYTHGRRPLSASQKTAIIVDDGLATGLTMKAAIKDLNSQHPKHIIVALPVAPKNSIEEIKQLVEKVVVLYVPKGFFGAIGAYYQNFEQVTDEEVVGLLDDYDGVIGIGVTTEDAGLIETPALIYPVSESGRIGVSTSKATNPIETDQGDEEYEGKLYGTPDDLEKSYGEEQNDVYVEMPKI